MTWSIVARDPDTGFLAVAVASRFFAVGAVCPWTEGGTGAVSTQALANPLLGPRALALLREGMPAEAVPGMLLAGDPGRDQRQLHLIDAQGRVAAYTGAGCVDWCGHMTGQQVSVAGNMLAGPAVIQATLEVYRSSPHLPLVDRLLTAMEAGEAAGGDKRGRQSAALIVHGPEAYARLDIRADDHPDPFLELRRLHEVAKERFVPFSRSFPTPERPHGILDRDLIERIIERDAGKPLSRDFEMP